MRLIDERSRLFGLVNPIDLLVLAIALVAVTAIGIALFGAPGEVPPATATIEFDVLVPRLEAFDADSVEAGDAIVEKTGGPLGQVVSVTASPSDLDVLTEDGIVWAKSETLQTVRLRVRAEAIVTDSGYSVRGMPIRENGFVNVYTAGFEATRAYVTNVRAVE